MNKPARINELAPAEQHNGPSLFVGIAYSVDEIVMGRNVINTKVAALKVAMTERHEAGVKQAAEEIAVITGQIQVLSAHLAGIIAKHQARRPR